MAFAIAIAQEGIDGIDELFGAGVDLGTNSYKNLAEAKVHTQLLLQNHWPFFNTEYDPLGLMTPLSGCEWDRVPKEELKLLPHQIDGIHALHHMFFSNNPNNIHWKQGVLVTDSMGLGKRVYVQNKTPIASVLIHFCSQAIGFMVHVDMQQESREG